MATSHPEEIVKIPAGTALLEGALSIPIHVQGLVVFAHGSGSSRHSPRNNFVAQTLRQAGIGTLLLDLLTEKEDATYATRFDIDLLVDRLLTTTEWLQGHLGQIGQPPTSGAEIEQAQDTTPTSDVEIGQSGPAQSTAPTIGYFGASTGAAAALKAAALLGTRIGAIVSRGGRPDLAGEALSLVQSPTLLIVGGNDHTVLQLNQHAYEWLAGEKQLVVIPGATHLFEEPGALEEVARLATEWFQRYLHV
jgi:putative phosphoribosyl transferase